MLHNHSSAENLYLHSPMMCSGVDLLLNTIADLILRDHILFVGGKKLRLNCNAETRLDHEKKVLECLDNGEILLTHFLKLFADTHSKFEYKEGISNLLASKGFLKNKCLRTSAGRMERRGQRNELSKYSELILKKETRDLSLLVSQIGANVYLLDEKTKSVIQYLYPKPIGVKSLLFKHYSLLYSTCKHRDFSGGWFYDAFAGLTDSSSGDGDFGGGFDGFGGGDFGGGGDGSDF